jgi:hypothetical protein
MLKHEVMTADERHDNGPHDLFTVSLCIEMAIVEIKWWCLSVAYACPNHKPTATMGLSVHISKPLAHMTP